MTGDAKQNKLKGVQALRPNFDLYGNNGGYSGLANESRNPGLALQQQAASMYGEQAAGRGPSAAQAMLQQQSGQNLRAAMAMQGRARGGNIGQTGQQASAAFGGAQAQLSQQAAAMRAQEQLQGMAGVAGMGSQMYNQGFAYDQLASQNALQSDQNALGWYSADRGMDIQQSNFDKQMKFGLANAGIGAAGAALGAAGGASDERLKQGVVMTGSGEELEPHEKAFKGIGAAMSGASEAFGSATQGARTGGPPAQAQPRQVPQLSGGVRERGNIDPYSQPEVRNGDGTVSTVDSVSFNLDGNETLLPRITRDGRRLATDADTEAEYRRTGRHLGKFDSPESASRFAEQLHREYEAGKYRTRPLREDQLRSNNIQLGRGGARGAEIHTLDGHRGPRPLSGVQTIDPFEDDGVSDERRKKASRSSSSADPYSATAAIDASPAVSYEYKDGTGLPEGRRSGVMAQNLERSPAGRAIVHNTPQGKTVDSFGAATLGLAGLSEMRQREVARDQQIAQLRRMVANGTNGEMDRGAVRTPHGEPTRGSVVEQGPRRFGGTQLREAPAPAPNETRDEMDYFRDQATNYAEQARNPGQVTEMDAQQLIDMDIRLNPRKYKALEAPPEHLAEEFPGEFRPSRRRPQRMANDPYASDVPKPLPRRGRAADSLRDMAARGDRAQAAHTHIRDLTRMFAEEKAHREAVQRATFAPPPQL